MTGKCVRCVLPFLLMMGVSTTSWAYPRETPEPSEEAPYTGQGESLDQDRGVVWFGGVGLDGIAVEGGTWDFTDGTTQGWTSTVPFEGMSRRVVASDFALDPASPMFSAPSTAQLWVGVHDGEADELGYATGMGYGDSWCQRLRSLVFPIAPGNSVTVNFKYITDSEDGYDSTAVYVVTYDVNGMSCWRDTGLRCSPG